MGFSDGTWLQIAIYLASFGTAMGSILTKLKQLEKKQDIHNGLIERMVVVESSCKSAHHRIDDHMCEERKEKEK